MHKNFIKTAFTSFVFGNTVFFLVLANLHVLPTDPKSAVFVDFWGRFTVYSLWYIMYTLYRKYLEEKPLIRIATIALITLNIPLFLMLAYFDKISMKPETIVMVDFWGRITVYSFWVIIYELYRKSIAENEIPIKQPAT